MYSPAQEGNYAPYEYSCRGALSRQKNKTLPAWAAAVRRLRERLQLSQEGLARRLELSVSEVRRWDQGLRAPSASRAITLARLAGPRDCWVFLELAGIKKEDLARFAQDIEGEKGRERKRIRRLSEETQEAAFGALEVILERAPSTVVEQTVDFLVSRAVKYGEKV